MLRRTLAGLAILALAVLPATAQGIGGTGITGSPTSPRVLRVPEEYPVICGIAQADCASADYVACSAGSALAAAHTAYQADPNISQLIDVGPGYYNECVAIRDMSNIHLHGSGIGSEIHMAPADNAIGDVCGILRIGDENDTGCTASGVPWTCCTGSGAGTCGDSRSDKNIEVDGFFLRGDGYSSPCPTIAVNGSSQTGITAGQSGAADHVWVHNVLVWGHHDGFQAFCSPTDLDPAGWPDIEFSDSRIVSGHDAVATKKTCGATFRNLHVSVVPNFCRDPNISTAAVGPTQVPADATDEDALCTAASAPYGCCTGPGAGSCENFALVLDPNDALPQTNAYSMRRIEFGDVDPNVPCVANSGNPRRISLYDPNNNIVFFDNGVAQYVTPPDTTCTYTIDAEPTAPVLNNTPACNTAPFWFQMPPSTDTNVYIGDPNATNAQISTGHKMTCYHNGNPGACPTVDPNNAGSFVHIDGMTCDIWDTGADNELIAPVRDRNSCNSQFLVNDVQAEVHILDASDGKFSTSNHALSCFDNNAPSISGNTQFSNFSCMIDNEANTELNVYGLLTANGINNAVLASFGMIDIKASVAGYNGVVEHYYSTAGKAGGGSYAIGRMVWGEMLAAESMTNHPFSIAPGGTLTGTTTADPNSITDTCETLPVFKIYGADTSDVCSISAETATTGALYDCTVTAADTITPRFCAIGTVDPASTVFDVKVTGR